MMSSLKIGVHPEYSIECAEPARSLHGPLCTRVADLTRRGRAIANQFVALYNSCHSERDRELILEAATELRMILMQPGIE